MCYAVFKIFLRKKRNNPPNLFMEVSYSLENNREEKERGSNVRLLRWTLLNTTKLDCLRIKSDLYRWQGAI